MIGRNKIEMCQAEMRNAMEVYLNDNVFRYPSHVKVVAVDARDDYQTSGFVIAIEEEDEEEPDRLGEEHIQGGTKCQKKKK